MKKRVLKSAGSLVLIIVLVLSMGASVFAATFNDVSGHWAETYIEYWANEKVVNGYTDGSFRPDAKISRAEAAAIMCRFLDLDTDTSISNPYTDVDANEWYYDEVLACYEAKVMIGNTDGTFAPKDNITREQAITTLGRAVNLREGTSGIEGFSDGSKVQDYAKGFVNAMVRDGYVNGYSEDNTLRPQADISRAEFVKILYRVITPVSTGTYQLNVVIEDTLDKSVTASSSAYLTPNSSLTGELVSLINANYDNFRAAFPSADMKKILDEGLAAYAAGDTAWADYVNKYYDDVTGSKYIVSIKDVLENSDSQIGELAAGVQYQMTFSDTIDGRTDVVYTVTLWIVGTN